MLIQQKLIFNGINPDDCVFGESLGEGNPYPNF